MSAGNRGVGGEGGGMGGSGGGRGEGGAAGGGNGAHRTVRQEPSGRRTGMPLVDDAIELSRLPEFERWKTWQPPWLVFARRK